MAQAQIRLRITTSGALRRRLQEDRAESERRTRQVMVESRNTFQQTVEDFAPERSRFMRTHVYAAPTHDGKGYEGGYRASDFLGKRNRFGELITRFYPVDQEYGTRFMPPHPSVTPAALQEFHRLPGKLVAAFEGRT